MTVQQCNKCFTIKPLEEYYTTGRYEHKACTICKECIRNKRSNYYKLNKEKCLSKHKQYVNGLYKNRKKLLDKLYAQKNKDKIKTYKKKYYQLHKEYYNKIARERYKTDIEHKIAVSHRNRLNSVIKFKRNFKSADLLGCSLKEVRAHLESKFQSGMSWDNYGDWHIDHVIPLYDFNLSLKEEQQKAFHYTNLQPLWAIDNLRKNKYGSKKEAIRN